MSTLQEKMQTDYTWIRSAPAENPRQRVHGYNYIYNNAPNKFERLEMIYRSIGKQFDWELEKFRQSKKNIDRGNKRRFFKNVFRFIKNPGGYIYWKTFRLAEHNPRFIVWGMATWLLLSVMHYKNMSDGVHRGNSILLRSGKNIEGTPGQYPGFYPKKYPLLLA